MCMHWDGKGAEKVNSLCTWTDGDRIMRESDPTPDVLQFRGGSTSTHADKAFLGTHLKE
jgi:hypothetical protein